MTSKKVRYMRDSGLGISLKKTWETQITVIEIFVQTQEILKCNLEIPLTSFHSTQQSSFPLFI